MDNCRPHGARISDSLGQVEILPSPPNCTAVHLPMNQCIIQAVQMKYWYKLKAKFSKQYSTAMNSDRCQVEC